MNNTRPQDILAEYADGLVKGSVRVEEVLEKYHILPGSELEKLLRIAALLDKVFVQVDPSPEFVRHLREELMAEDVITLVQRIRQLTTLQIAAGLGGITFAAGVLWWARRLNEEARLRRRTLGEAQESALAS